MHLFLLYLDSPQSSLSSHGHRLLEVTDVLPPSLKSCALAEIPHETDAQRSSISLYKPILNHHPIAVASIKTRILVISDTHSEDLIHKPITCTYDVAIHCGDLTEESKLDEFRASLNMMLSVQAPLKLIIAGNHDFSLDTPVLKNRLADNTTAEDADLVKRTYGNFGKARAIFESDASKAAGVVFLDESNYTFSLANDASLSVCASPSTASKACTWGATNTDPLRKETTTHGTSSQAPTSSSPIRHPKAFCATQTIKPEQAAQVSSLPLLKQNQRCTASATPTKLGALKLSDGVRPTLTIRRAGLKALCRPASQQSTTTART